MPRLPTVERLPGPQSTLAPVGGSVRAAALQIRGLNVAGQAAHKQLGQMVSHLDQQQAARNTLYSQAMVEEIRTKSDEILKEAQQGDGATHPGFQRDVHDKINEMAEEVFSGPLSEGMDRMGLGVARVRSAAVMAKRDAETHAVQMVVTKSRLTDQADQRVREFGLVVYNDPSMRERASRSFVDYMSDLQRHLTPEEFRARMIFGQKALWAQSVYGLAEQKEGRLAQQTARDAAGSGLFEPKEIQKMMRRLRKIEDKHVQLEVYDHELLIDMGGGEVTQLLARNSGLHFKYPDRYGAARMRKNRKLILAREAKKAAKATRAEKGQAWSDKGVPVSPFSTEEHGYMNDHWDAMRTEENFPETFSQAWTQTLNNFMRHYKTFPTDALSELVKVTTHGTPSKQILAAQAFVALSTNHPTALVTFFSADAASVAKMTALADMKRTSGLDDASMVELYDKGIADAQGKDAQDTRVRRKKTWADYDEETISGELEKAWNEMKSEQMPGWGGSLGLMWSEQFGGPEEVQGALDLMRSEERFGNGGDHSGANAFLNAARYQPDWAMATAMGNAKAEYMRTGNKSGAAKIGAMSFNDVNFDHGAQDPRWMVDAPEHVYGGHGDENTERRLLVRAIRDRYDQVLHMEGTIRSGDNWKYVPNYSTDRTRGLAVEGYKPRSRRTHDGKLMPAYEIHVFRALPGGGHSLYPEILLNRDTGLPDLWSPQDELATGSYFEEQKNRYQGEYGPGSDYATQVDFGGNEDAARLAERPNEVEIIPDPEEDEGPIGLRGL